MDQNGQSLVEMTMVSGLFLFVVFVTAAIHDFHRTRYKTIVCAYRAATIASEDCNASAGSNYIGDFPLKTIDQQSEVDEDSRGFYRANLYTTDPLSKVLLGLDRWISSARKYPKVKRTYTFWMLGNDTGYEHVLWE